MFCPCKIVKTLSLLFILEALSFSSQAFAQSTSSPDTPQAKQANPNEGWHVEITPYLWFAGVHGTTGALEASVDASFDSFKYCVRQLDLAPFDLLFWPHPLVIHHSAPGRSEALRRSEGDVVRAQRRPGQSESFICCRLSSPAFFDTDTIHSRSR
jgi:hypothetical protein